MAQRRIPEKTIILAISGDEQAISCIVNHYERYIKKISLHEIHYDSERIVTCVDAELESILKIKLMDAILKFKII